MNNETAETNLTNETTETENETNLTHPTSENLPTTPQTSNGTGTILSLAVADSNQPTQPNQQPNHPGWELEIISHTGKGLGLTANVIATGLDNKQHMAPVKLFTDTGRAMFAEECAKALDLPPSQQAEIKAWLQAEGWKLLSQIGQPASSVSSYATAMSDEAREEAHELLKDPQILHRITEVVGRLGVAGEANNALILYLAITSRFMKRR